MLDEIHKQKNVENEIDETIQPKHEKLDRVSPTFKIEFTYDNKIELVPVKSDKNEKSLIFF